MARLNKKSTKAAIVKLLHRNEYFGGASMASKARVESYLLGLAKELELDIKPEEYK